MVNAHTYMRYLREIKEVNLKAHTDIEQDVQVKQDGVFTFVLRVNNGVIVDYNVMEYIDYNKYEGIEQGIIKELTAAYDHSAGDTGDTLRTDNLQR